MNPLDKQNRDIKVRKALKEEIDWINHLYDEAHFIRSNYDNEWIAIAEIKGEKGGVGRLVQIDSKTVELGGMYVLEEWRGRGVAKHIIHFLLGQAKGKTVYCIPFTHLLALYQSFGFVLCENLYGLPQTLVERYQWCKGCYKNRVALLWQKIF